MSTNSVMSEFVGKNIEIKSMTLESDVNIFKSNHVVELDKEDLGQNSKTVENTDSVTGLKWEQINNKRGSFVIEDGVELDIPQDYQNNSNDASASSK